jgi:hypothetical protein
MLDEDRERMVWLWNKIEAVHHAIMDGKLDEISRHMNELRGNVKEWIYPHMTISQQEDLSNNEQIQQETAT